MQSLAELFAPPGRAPPDANTNVSSCKDSTPLAKCHFLPASKPLKTNTVQTSNYFCRSIADRQAFRHCGISERFTLETLVRPRDVFHRASKSLSLFLLFLAVNRAQPKYIKCRKPEIPKRYINWQCFMFLFLALILVIYYSFSHSSSIDITVSKGGSNPSLTICTHL